MASVICGSVAYDTIMTFDGHFREHILPDKIHILNVSFLVPSMRREFGGCAGNIAYTLKLLGGEPIIMGTVGQDAGPYLDYLKKLGISTKHITEIPDTFTAQAMITTDRDNNQITAFHPGAMSQSSVNSVKDALPARLGLVGPDSRDGMLHHATQFAEAGVPFIFDLGQAMPLFDGADLRHFVELATYVVVNDYEAQVMLSRTGYSATELAQRVERLHRHARGRRGGDSRRRQAVHYSRRAGRARGRPDRLRRRLPRWAAVRYRERPGLGNHRPPRQPDGLAQDRLPGPAESRPARRRNRPAL